MADEAFAPVFYRGTEAGGEGARVFAEVPPKVLPSQRKRTLRWLCTGVGIQVLRKHCHPLDFRPGPSSECTSPIKGSWDPTKPPWVLAYLDV